MCQLVNNVIWMSWKISVIKERENTSLQIYILNNSDKSIKTNGLMSDN